MGVLWLSFFSFAHAEPESAAEMTLYGLGHLSADYNNDGSDDKANIASNSSRLGVNGGYAFHDNLKFIAQYENGIDLTADRVNDGNGGKGFNNVFTKARDSFVGIGGSWGTIKMGRLGILNQWVYDYNLFADQVGDLGNIWGGTGLPGRANKTVSYETPLLKMRDAGNLSANVLHSYDPDTGGGNDKITTLKLNYGTDSFSMGAAHARVEQISPADDHTVTAITASYKTKRLDLSGIPASGFDIGGGFQTESDIAGSGSGRNSYTLGAALHIAEKHTLKTQFAYSDTDWDGNDAGQIAAGYDYKFKENLTFYVAAASTFNDSLAAFTANNYGHGKTDVPAAGDDPFSVSVGLVYKFDYSLSE